RSDLFSLGASLYAVLTGARPFAGEDLSALAYAICHVEPEPPSRHAPSLPAACDGIVLKALAKDPSRRYQTGHEMAADLRSLAGAGGDAAGIGRSVAAVESRAARLMARGALGVAGA